MTIHDKARLKSIQKGDIYEYELLFREFYKPLLNYAVSIVKSEEEAEEIIQNLFFEIWKNKESLDIHSSFSSYLYKATRNNSLQLLKKQKRIVDFQNEPTTWAYPQSMNPGEVLQYNELIERVNKVVDSLPENSKTIFKLNRFQGLKYSEIAEKLKINIKTVEANMTKALKHIRQHLNDYAAN